MKNVKKLGYGGGGRPDLEFILELIWNGDLWREIAKVHFQFGNFNKLAVFPISRPECGGVLTFFKPIFDRNPGFGRRKLLLSLHWKCSVIDRTPGKRHPSSPRPPRKKRKYECHSMFVQHYRIRTSFRCEFRPVNSPHPGWINKKSTTESRRLFNLLH